MQIPVKKNFAFQTVANVGRMKERKYNGDSLHRNSMRGLLALKATLVEFRTVQVCNF
jgi:hypothetical protein